MDWLSSKIDSVIVWFLHALQTIWTAFTDFLRDFVVYVLDGIFGAVSGIIAAIPAPSFLAANNLTNLFSGLPPSVLWLLSQSGVAEGFAIIAAGVAFNLLRKIVTLGQW